MKFKFPIYAFAFELATAFTLKTILFPGTKPHVEGSAAPLAIPTCHDETEPVETATGDPQAVSPVDASLLYTW